jgi:hypothetical protein
LSSLLNSIVSIYWIRLPALLYSALEVLNYSFISPADSKEELSSFKQKFRASSFFFVNDTFELSDSHQAAISVALPRKFIEDK